MSTIKDVARLSGVSTTTVSEVLNNGWRPVHVDTRQRVLEAARQLNYRPNALARGLVGKRMNTIGVVFTQWDAPQSSPFVLNALLGMLSICSVRKQNTMLFSLDFWEQSLERLPEMCDGRCDGLLLAMPPEDSRLSQELSQRKMPHVLLSAQDPTGKAPGVDVDNRYAAFQMTNALLQMGHRRIAFVRHPATQESVMGFARERRAGYREAMTAANVYDPDLSDLPGIAAALSTLQLASPPTAFFCLYDDLALALIEQLQRQNVRVPDEVSVAGFDDIPLAALSQPALSTVRQSIGRLGERATELLLDLVEGVAVSGERELLPTEIVMRASTCPPRR